MICSGIDIQAQYILSNHIDNLSQNTNYYINAFDGLVYISSIDGLNVFDGGHTYTYLNGANVQSNIFVDLVENIWFTSYESLHIFNINSDSIENIILVSTSNDTLRSNYRAIHLEGSFLYLKAGEFLFSYDVVKRKPHHEYSINLSSYFELSLIKGSAQSILFAGRPEGFLVVSLNENGTYERLDSANQPINFVYTSPSKFWWVGHSTGQLSQYIPGTKGLQENYFISDAAISGITAWSSSELLISTSGGELIIFNTDSRTITERITPVNAATNELVKQPINPYIDEDSTLWMGGDGQGVFFSNLKKRKFKHFLGAGPGEAPLSITKIIELNDGSFLALVRRHGIIHFDKHGQKLKEWTRLPNGQSSYNALRGCMLDRDKLLFSLVEQIYELDLASGKIRYLPLPTSAPYSIAQIEMLDNGKIIGSFYDSLLQEMIVHPDHIDLKPYGGLKSKSATTTFFKIDRENNLYVSNDERTILVLKPDQNGIHQFVYELPINGGVWGLHDDAEHGVVYISNSLGLFQVNPKTWEYKRLLDEKKLLAQTIYSVQQDSYGNLWMGTNKGLVKYYPANNESKAFSIMDGIQAMEYNSHAYLTTSDGYMMFGGINGINYFHPAEVKFSEKPAPVYVSEILINDELDSTYRVAQYVDALDLPYQSNTVSFEFHAIDYADPQATRVKYQLIGVDEDFVESKEAQGFARYANLRPGHYELAIIGQNSDGVWNQEPRIIDIKIHPPFWMTWWFITLTSLIVIGSFYYLIRSYYQRKLVRKNQLLREQALIIEKQQAVEHERTRIASEMHDDLGSGLTTIRYLSDKALTQAKDPEEAEQIKRIAEHSNRLVRNMSEIIWAMNSRFDTAENLVGYLRRYASEYLSEHQMPLTFTFGEEDLDKIPVGGEKRRNIFLVFKEVLHNAIKYSKATNINIHVNSGQELSITVSEEGGTGFDPDISQNSGNGLYNCRKRMETIGGRISHSKTSDAMNTIISVPLENASDVNA